MVLGTFLVLSLDDSRCMCAGCLSTLGFSARMKVGGLEVDLLYVLFIYLFRLFERFGVLCCCCCCCCWTRKCFLPGRLSDVGVD